LSVQAAQAAGDGEHAARGRALIQVMAPHAPGRHSSPAKLQHLKTAKTSYIANGIITL